ncbi:MAG TPA: PAS domain S-box protein, partial [Prolixibacteraceae bacterium]|nr:PAS domain S-box protein [Prolixibacteraceae bacterium]
MNRNRIIFLLVAIALLTFVALLGNVFNTSLKKRMIDGAQNELVSIAKLKADNIEDWYSDELIDAQIITQNKYLIDHVHAFVKSNNSTDSLILNQNLKSIIAEHGYHKIMLITSHAQVLVSSHHQSNTLPHNLIDSAQMVFIDKTVTSTGLYRDEYSDSVYIDFISPIEIEGFGRELAIVFRVNPVDFLYPLVQNWPLPSETAENSIFKIENDSIVFLNELRHLSQKALSVKIPLSNNHAVAVKALADAEKIHEGFDYRNVETVAYVSPINGTPWYLLSKIDTSELYAKVDDQSRLFNLGLAFLLMLILSLLAFLYSNSQKNIYKKLWLAQEEFKTTLYSIGDGVITTDRNGNITHMNPIAEKLTGWAEKEVKGLFVEKVFYIVNEVSFEKVVNPVRVVLEKGKVVGLANHTLLISKQGTKIPIADSGAPILDESGTITGVVLVFRDQTTERQQHEIIDEQRRRLYTLMSNLPGMAYRCKNDADWTMEFVSKGCFELTGYNDYEIEQNKLISYGKLIHPNYCEFVQKEVDRALMSRKYFEIQYAIVDRKGIERWVWEKGQGIIDSNGEVVAIEGFISDITQLNEIESQLRQSENLFQTMALNLGVGIFKTDSKGYTTFVNPKYCEMTGLSASEAMGLGWLKNVHPDDKQKLNNNWANALLNKSEKVEDYRFINPVKGKTVWVSGRVTPEFDSDKNILGYIGYISDITEMVQSEQEISHKNLLINAVIQNIPDAVYMKDKQGRKLIANNADVENCGFDSLDEIIGKNDFELFPQEIAQKFWDD